MKSLVSVFFITASTVLWAANLGAAQNAGACVTCHTYLGGELAKPVTAWESSVHAQNDITCDYCHGGDASVELGDIQDLSSQEFDEKQAIAMSKSSDFIGIPTGREMFDMCGMCHDDSVARYADSIMGRAYLEDRGGPSCITCHNAHNNIMPAVPGSCENCHENTAGYNSIDPMNVTDATINKLSGIRIRLAEKKTKGTRPEMIPEFPEDMDTYLIGLAAFGAVFILFLIGGLIYMILEKRR